MNLLSIALASIGWQWGFVAARLEAEQGFVPPKGYVCFRTDHRPAGSHQESSTPQTGSTITVDGKLDEPAWSAAPWTDDFVDIEGDLKPQPRFRTRAKMLWDEQYFYIAAELEEPHLQATYTEHDSPIFHEDNDFEIFIDPDGDSHNYVEFELNALNTGWDLHLTKPYKNGGKADNSWEIPGLKTAVQLNGTLNNPGDTDRGWAIEIAIPWEVLGKLTNRPAPPRDGEHWRVNFSRVEWQFDTKQGKYLRLSDRSEDNWVWSPQWTINMHRPETWGYVQFATAVAGSPGAARVAFRPDPAGAAKHLLHRVLYAQQDFRQRNDHWAGTLDELALGNLNHDSLAGPLAMNVVDDRFEATAMARLPNDTTATWHIRADARVWQDDWLVVDIWPGNVPNETGDIGRESIRMSPKLDRKQVEVTESTRMLTNVTRPTVSIYRPEKEKDTGTAMLICPGGGYWNLYWELEGLEVASWLNSQGITGIVLKYRVPRRPDEPQGEPARRPLQDVQRAVSLVRSKSREWGIEPDRIGIVGFSAGGHLAISAATNFEQRAYEPIDDVDNVSCRPDFAVAVYSGYLKAKDKDELAPGLRVPAGTPPIFLAHGGEDIISSPEHSLFMYLALKRAGVPAELHIYASTTHDFGVRTSQYPYATWTESCIRWLKHQGLLHAPMP